LVEVERGASILDLRDEGGGKGCSSSRIDRLSWRSERKSIVPNESRPSRLFEDGIYESLNELLLMVKF